MCAEMDINMLFCVLVIVWQEGFVLLLLIEYTLFRLYVYSKLFSNHMCSKALIRAPKEVYSIHECTLAKLQDVEFAMRMMSTKK